MTASEGTAFAAWWAERFGEVAPLGHRLRRALDERWVRVHSLPDSKRYAQTADEHAEVLHRARTMAGELFAPDRAVWLVTVCWTHVDEPASTHELAAAPGLTLARAQHVPPHDDDASGWVYAAKVTWPHAGLDDVLAAIAAWNEDALWASVETGEVFAPYDGGIDLIVANPERRAELVQRHAAWRSAHPQGL